MGDRLLQPAGSLLALGAWGGTHGVSRSPGGAGSRDTAGTGPAGLQERPEAVRGRSLLGRGGA